MKRVLVVVVVAVGSALSLAGCEQLGWPPMAMSVGNGAALVVCEPVDASRVQLLQRTDQGNVTIFVISGSIQLGPENPIPLDPEGLEQLGATVEGEIDLQAGSSFNVRIDDPTRGTLSNSIDLPASSLGNGEWVSDNGTVSTTACAT